MGVNRTGITNVSFDKRFFNKHMTYMTYNKKLYLFYYYYYIILTLNIECVGFD